MLPEKTEWDFGGLPEQRRTRLDVDISFADILGRIQAEANDIRGSIKRFDSPPQGMKRLRSTTFQACYAMAVDRNTVDLFYNARDGLRGCYWQSPDRGLLATRDLINLMQGPILKVQPCLDGLSGSIRSNAETWIQNRLIQASLGGVSAKAWVLERDREGNFLFDTTPSEQICIPRWQAFEPNAEHNRGAWRWMPTGNCIEIKGALIDLKGQEHIPEAKRDRSCQIHRSGFT